MKNLNLIWTMILLVMAGCGQRQAGNDDFITVDVTKTDYPKKELILQDFMDVEYVPLETKEGFYNRGVVNFVGEKFILVTNSRNGDIFIYGRDGKAIQKINRKGQGPEEYISINAGIILDEDNNEILSNDLFNRRILVYDLRGNFKRSFKQKVATDHEEFYTNIFNYDKGNLICYNEYNEKIPFLIVSKQDGSITKEIEIPYEKKKFLRQIKDGETPGSATVVFPGRHRSMIPHKGNWILIELSSDTVYTMLPDYSLHPFLVRSPSIQSMDPEIFLTLHLISDSYLFMEATKNEYNWETRNGFPKTYMMYDRQEKAMRNYTIFNGDYSIKKEMYMSATTPVNHEIESWYPLEAYKLVESYNKGELKGKLKEIAATLNEESNPVIMLIKHKK
ncbi:6-bladed beta-propeller [Parabacteroides sp. Marseille-P3160]|uniref:6-bladed beta-propeller n=1 Tax=Parabacteroides sp. Marseille-P3160 TaxID=1917887 RepID=UPI0009BA43F3|nr:6-bladed beta-propeller [Parabacteroides sp. Marseille-P3160]